MTIIYNDVSDFIDISREGHYSHRILIEGDSWTSHPFIQDLSDHLNEYDSLNYLILHYASPGDEARVICREHGDQMRRIRKVLSDNSGLVGKFDLILFSAGGNDIVGAEIAKNGYVDGKSKTKSGRDRLTREFHKVIEDVIDGYKTLIRVRNESTNNSSTPIVTHCYSYLLPREEGTSIFGMELNSGWVKRYLRKIGIHDVDEMYDIVCGMLDIFYTRLSELASDCDNFVVADTREVLLKDNKPQVDLWADEIHPTRKGFKKVMNHIRDAAKEKDMWKV